MAVKLNDGEFWLPAEIFDDDFHVERRRAATEEEKLVNETERDGRDYIAGLARRMAHNRLHENNNVSISSAKSTLSEAGIWSAANVPSLVSPPPATAEQRENAWDLLYSTAGEIMRMGEIEHHFHGRRLSCLPKKSFSSAKSSSAAFTRLPIVTLRQLRAEQFYQMKQQQLIKQQLATAWNRQSKASSNRSNSRITDFTQASAFSSFQRQQTLPVITPLSFDGHVSRRLSAGTGVFIPKQIGVTNEQRKNPASPALQASVLQALELDEGRVGFRQHSNGVYATNYEAFARRNPPLAPPKGNQQKQHHCHASSAAVSSHSSCLPPEWTY